MAEFGQRGEQGKHEARSEKRWFQPAPVLWVASLIVGACASPQAPVAQPTVEPSPPPEPSELESEERLIERARERLTAGHLKEGLELARVTLEQRPALDAFRLDISVLLWRLGKRREAVELLDARPTSLSPLSEAARLSAVMHFELAKDGPNITHSRTGITASPSKNPEADKRWVAEQFGLAEKKAATFLELSASSNEAGAALALVVSIAVEQKKWEEALAALEAHPKLVSSSAQLLSQKGRAYLETGAFQQAIALARSGLQHEPRSLALLRILEQAASALNETEEAQRAAALGAFYGFLVPGSQLEFEAERAAILADLASYFERSGSAQDAESLGLLVEQRLDELALQGDAAAAEMLGAFVYHHSHDSREERAVRALEAMGQEAHPVLLRMLKVAGSVCTIRSAVEILSRHRVKAALPTMLALLPQDQRFGYPMYIPQALARMGDVGAVPALSEFVLSAPPSELDSMSEIGRSFAREQAALALGVLGGADAKAALSKATHIPEMQTAAMGGLCLQRLKEIENEPAWEVGGPLECQAFVEKLSPDDMGSIGVGGQALVALEIMGGSSAQEWRPELERLKKE